MFTFRRFQSRILVYFLGLMALTQAFAFFAFYNAAKRETRRQIGIGLEADAQAFSGSLKIRATQLTTAANTLSWDFAFKRVFSESVRTMDHDSILAALQSLVGRIGADIIVLVSLDGNVICDTSRTGSTGAAFSNETLIKKAESADGASDFILHHGKAYQVTVVPIKAPETIAWIVVGIQMNQKLAREFKSMTDETDVSILKSLGGRDVQVAATTLPAGLRGALVSGLHSQPWKNRKSYALMLEQREYEVLVMELGQGTGIVLTRPLHKRLEAFLAPLRTAMLFIALLGLFSAVLGAIWLSRSVTRPVHTLVDGVRRAARGDYGHRVTVTQQDEIGELAAAFNEMTRGLDERDRMRDLLGKVVSPQIAAEMLARGVELGGEERETTILFSDIRNFTTLSETMPPREVIDILNTYLTRMSAVVERNGGVVDKYVGDAIMALFGVPVAHDDDPERAMRTALEMIAELESLNRDFTAQGKPALAIGIGVNTAMVVAGNVGSSTRLDYTVIGDGVNVAARLETLTKNKEYDTRIIVSEDTLNKSGNRFQARPLGEVMVKGRKAATRIFALPGLQPADIA